MLDLSIRHNFGLLETAVMAMSKNLVGKAGRVALTRTVAGARVDIQKELPRIFDRPTPFTVNSIRYAMSSKDHPEATVFISDDAAKGLSPRSYLAAEIQGGERRLKRSEKALISKGMMEAGQRIVPGRGLDLDRYGNLSGSKAVQILSRLSAFGEMGYRANVGERTKRKLAKAGLATRRTGADFFIGKSRRGGEPLAVYQLVAKGQVRPVLAFVDKLPVYKPRFPFHEYVHASASARWPVEVARAFEELLQGKL